ncbi:MAG: class B sortase [Clostridiaceae bacterium]
MKKKYILLGLFLLFLVQLFLYQDSLSSKYELEAGQEAYEALAESRSETTEDILPYPSPQDNQETSIEPFPSIINEKIPIASNPFAKYFSINPDFAGWLTIGDTKVNYPVARGSDNTYYLEHSFEKKKNELGSIFMDYRNVGMGVDSHTVLYGHYTESGYMFGDLDRYLSKKYLDAHSEIVFSDPYTERHYRIFSVHVSPPDGAILPVGISGEEFLQYVSLLKEYSVHLLDVSVTETDHILTLVTCNYGIKDGRLFIHAVEITDH